MQQELFDVLAKARCIDELRTIKPMAQEVRAKYMDGLRSVDVKDLAIHQRWSTIREEEAEASEVKAYQKCGLPLAPGMRSDMSRRMPRGRGEARKDGEGV